MDQRERLADRLLRDVLDDVGVDRRARVCVTGRGTRPCPGPLVICCSGGALRVPGLQSTYFSPISDCGRIAHVALAWNGVKSALSISITAARRAPAEFRGVHRQRLGSSRPARRRSARPRPTPRTRRRRRSRAPCRDRWTAARRADAVSAERDRRRATTSTAAIAREAPHGPGGVELRVAAGHRHGAEPSASGCTAPPGQRRVHDLEARRSGLRGNGSASSWLAPSTANARTPAASRA